MGLFSKFGGNQQSPEKMPVNTRSYPGSPSSGMTEMTQFSESSSSQSQSRSPRSMSSGGSFATHSTGHSQQSSYSSRKAEKGWVQDINKHHLMAKHLYRNCKKNNWLEGKANEAAVALRTFQGGYILYPQDDADDRFENAVKGLNVEVCIRVNSDVVKVIMNNIPHNICDVPLRDDSRIQILEDIEDLPRARKHQYAAFIREDCSLLVWADSASRVIDDAMDIEKKIIELIWDDGDSVGRYEKVIEEDDDELELEKGYVPPKRGRVLLQPLLVGGAWILIFLFIGSGLKILLREIAITGEWSQLCFLLTSPILFFAMFFAIVVVSYCLYIFGPSSQVFGNSMFFSGRAPERRITGELPHITIQCPVYKESLAGVIDPTVQSLKVAISTYELQGGTASIFINDDGMQLLDPEMAELRQHYYRNHNIGWVARPPHKKDGFLRAGRFKKASNMNFAMNLAYNVEERLRQVERPEGWTDTDEDAAYEEVLERVVKEDGFAWAAGDIRMGEIILIVDSDTRVPEDCLLDAATEFHECPDIAVLQHKSGVMQVVHNYWENGITYFTRLIYASITYAVAAGDTGPFVGYLTRSWNEADVRHNAFIRWSALQEMLWIENGQKKWWSESHVSEDFEMSLKLQNAGWRVRYATYHGDGFQEGVSLTIYDELARWEKYSYGCAELMFHPIKLWFKKGPFTPLFRAFLKSNIKGASKFTIMAYIGTYYAMASTWICVLVNYFVEGWFSQSVDQYYMDSFSILITVSFVFTIFGPLFNAILRYRCKMDSFGHALVENYMWTPMFIIFFGGLSMHLSYALLCYLLSIDMQWGATAKELEASNFWKELPKIIRDFKFMYMIVISGIIMMIVLAYAVPVTWQIRGFFPCLPLGLMLACHFVLPLALNPQLMSFSF